jgi:hypothetical protein
MRALEAPGCFRVADNQEVMWYSETAAERWRRRLTWAIPTDPELVVCYAHAQ